MQQRTYQFGVFELNAGIGELRKHGIKLKLQDQPLQILTLLLEGPGELATREEIQKRLWPDDNYVDFDNAINSAVRKLRDALSDSPQNPRYVETLARRGYRFIAPVSQPVDGRQPIQEQQTAVQTVAKRHFRWAIPSVSAAILFVAIGLSLWITKSRNARIDEPSAPVPFTSYQRFRWSPSFSPEGTRVAFTWDEPGKHAPSIYVKLIGPTDPVRLTSGEDTDFAPAWSPDGHSIAFLRAKGPNSAAVMLIPALGGAAREVTRLQLNMARFFYYGWWGASPPFLAWSLDGKWLLALEQSESERPTREATVRIVRISVESGEKTAFLLSLNADQDGRNELRPLMKGEEGLRVSPDGRKLAFIHTVDSPNSAVYIVPLTNEMMRDGDLSRM
jgi:DNA-binding winged helix-turn-helix (wHTH) protein